MNVPTFLHHWTTGTPNSYQRQSEAAVLPFYVWNFFLSSRCPLFPLLRYPHLPDIRILQNSPISTQFASSTDPLVSRVPIFNAESGTNSSTVNRGGDGPVRKQRRERDRDPDGTFSSQFKYPLKTKLNLIQWKMDFWQVGLNLIILGL